MNKEKILKILKNTLTVVVILALFIIVFYQNRDRDIFKFGRDESSEVISSNQDSSAGYSEGILGKIDDKVALLTTTSYSISDQNGEAKSDIEAFVNNKLGLSPDDTPDKDIKPENIKAVKEGMRL